MSEFQTSEFEINRKDERAYRSRVTLLKLYGRLRRKRPNTFNEFVDTFLQFFIFRNFTYNQQARGPRDC